MSRFCVINTEDSKIWNPVTFADMFEAGLRKDGDIWSVCNLASGSALPADIMDFTGIVITGSHYNTRDRDSLSWFEPLCNLIRQSAEIGQPRVYGGCFGCQIIAHALGGEVDYNPEKQFALKAENITILPSYSKYLTGRGSCCDDEKCTCLNIIVSHGECVVKLPPTADLIGTSGSCVNEMFVVGPKKSIICCQSHPEILDIKYSIYDRIAPVVIDERKRLVGEQVTECMTSLEKFSGEDSRLFLSNVSDFLHGVDVTKPAVEVSQAASMATAATRLTSLAETAKRATKGTPGSLSRSASSVSNTPADAAARQAQMAETATRLALLASNIAKKTTPLASPNATPNGSRSSPSLESRKSFRSVSSVATTSSATSSNGKQAHVESKADQKPLDDKTSTPSTRPARVMKSGGKSSEAVKAPTVSKQESEFVPEVSKNGTSTHSSSSLNKDLMAEVVTPAATNSVAVAATSTFTPIVAEEISFSPQEIKPKTPTFVDANRSSAPTVTESKVVTPSSEPENKSTANSNNVVSYVGIYSIFSLLVLGGLSFFMYRKWRR